MRVSLQSVFVACIFLSKKKYIARDAAGNLVSIGTPNVRSDWPPVLKSAYTHIACALLDGIGDHGIETLVKEQVHRILGCTCVSDFVAYRRVADPNSSSRHAELARTESFRDDGARYNSGDAIEFVMHTRDGHRGGASTVQWSSPQHLPASSRVAVTEYVRLFMDQVKPLLLAALGTQCALRCTELAKRGRTAQESRCTAFHDADI